MNRQYIHFADSKTLLKKGSQVTITLNVKKKYLQEGMKLFRLADGNIAVCGNKSGSDVVVVKNGKRICGTGAAFGNAPIVQNKAYFEIKLQSSGVWGVGLATRKCNVDKLPLGDTEESWVLRQDGKCYHKNEEIGKLSEIPQEGDVLGLSYDHVEFNIMLNGKPASCTLRGIKGTIFPIFYVDDGATLDVQFTNFYHPPPDGFDSIMIEQSLL